MLISSVPFQIVNLKIFDLLEIYPCTIIARNANLVLNGNTFESSGMMDLSNTVVNIDDCTFTSNIYYGGHGEELSMLILLQM